MILNLAVLDFKVFHSFSNVFVRSFFRIR